MLEIRAVKKSFNPDTLNEVRALHNEDLAALSGLQKGRAGAGKI